MENHLVDGFKVQTVREDNTDGLKDVSEEVLPGVIRFHSLEVNQGLCGGVSMEGVFASQLMRGHRPPRDWVSKVASDFRTLRLLSEMCPQMSMRVLLMRVEDSIDAFRENYFASGVDFLELGRYHLRYMLLKDFLSYHAIPGVSWEELSEGWGFDELERRVFTEYRDITSEVYNDIFAFTGRGDFVGPIGGGGSSSSSSSSRRPASGSGAPALNFSRGLSPEAFHAACPELLDVGGSRVAEVKVLPPRDGSPGRVEAPVPVSLLYVGNALSQYWRARGLAHLAGLAFTTRSGLCATPFLQALPRTAAPPAGEPNVSALAAACAACRTTREWVWPQYCLGPWGSTADVRERLAAETRRALAVSGVERAARELLGPRDVAVHLRCLHDFSDTHPLPAFSLYTALRRYYDTSVPGLRFLLVAGMLGQTCQAVALALEAFLLREFPGSKVVRRYATSEEKSAMAEDILAQPGGVDTTEMDLALLIFAPVLIRTPGTFSLVTAFSRQGLVLSPPNPRGRWSWRTAAFGPHWRWLQSPLLIPKVAREHGFDFRNPGPWIRWLETH